MTAEKISTTMESKEASATSGRVKFRAQQRLTTVGGETA